MEENLANKFAGKTILKATFDEDDNSLFLDFSDGIRITIFDDMQLCCENCFMKIEDDIKFLNGKILKSIHIKSARPDDIVDKYGDIPIDDMSFIEIQTDKGSITISNYHQHIGCNGGFNIFLRES